MDRALVITGLTGANETGIEAFAYIFNTSEQLVIACGAINIATNGIISTGLSHTPTRTT